jgi:mRNA interferase RelE/StbE
MEVKFSRPFEKDLKAISEKQIILKVDEIINELRINNSLQNIAGIKKLKGHEGCYRIRIGNYRLGLKVEGKIVWLARLMLRRDIYKYFP